MGLCERLPIYVPADNLIDFILRLHKDMPRIYKYNIGTDLVNLAFHLQDSIYDANSSEEPERRLAYVNELARTANMIMRRMRKVFALKIINEKRYSQYIEMANSIGKQATAWKKFCMNRRP